MRRLPPLTALEAFLQVARLGSIKAAAEDLSLSSPALSRRVQALERFIGRPLFERRHQAVVLNGDGERLLSQIAPALDSLSDAVETMTSGTEVLRLRLGILPLYASQRLFPQLPKLRARHPELHLDIDTTSHSLSRLGDGLDAAITLAREIDPALHARRLDRNRVFVIGSRRLLERGEAEMVVGSKAARGSRDERPIMRRVATRTYNGLLRVALKFKGTDTHGLKAFKRDRLLAVAKACVTARDVFASEFVIRAWRAGLNVVEIPIQLQEKRKPSVHLFRRVPNVLKNVSKLVYVIRVRGG